MEINIFRLGLSWNSPRVWKKRNFSRLCYEKRTQTKVHPQLPKKEADSFSISLPSFYSVTWTSITSSWPQWLWSGKRRHRPYSMPTHMRHQACAS